MNHAFDKKELLDSIHMFGARRTKEEVLTILRNLETYLANSNDPEERKASLNANRLYEFVENELLSRGHIQAASEDDGEE